MATNNAVNVGLAGETGTGTFVGSDSAVLTGAVDAGGADSFEIPNGAAPTVDVAGEIAVDTTITDYTGLIKFHDGVEELTGVAMPTANLSTTNNDVVKYDAVNNEFTMGAASAASGGWVLIETINVTGSTATVDITDLSETYWAYVILLQFVDIDTTAKDFSIRTSTDNGVSFESGASDYTWAVSQQGSGSRGTDGEIVVVDAVGTAAGDMITGVIWVMNPADATYVTTTNYNGGYNKGGMNAANSVGRRAAAEANDAIRFLVADTGNFDVFQAKVYGVLAA